MNELSGLFGHLGSRLWSSRNLPFASVSICTLD
jgi:hypothetical protein